MLDGEKLCFLATSTRIQEVIVPWRLDEGGRSPLNTNDLDPGMSSERHSLKVRIEFSFPESVSRVSLLYGELERRDV